MLTFDQNRTFSLIMNATIIEVPAMYIDFIIYKTHRLQDPGRFAVRADPQNIWIGKNIRATLIQSPFSYRFGFIDWLSNLFPEKLKW